MESIKPDLVPDSLPSAPRPVQDEWGLYDPEQAGLEAVLRRLPVDEDASDASDR